jgi:hypothetical protein
MKFIEIVVRPTGGNKFRHPQIPVEQSVLVLEVFHRILRSLFVHGSQKPPPDYPYNKQNLQVFY